MTKRRAAVAFAFTAAVLAAPAQGQAASLTADKPCYGGRDTLVLTGRGFTPQAPAALSVNVRGANFSLGDRRADAAGVFQYISRTPPVTLTARRTDVFSAIDHANPANRAHAPVLLSRVAVRIPLRGTSLRRIRIRATGFTTGRVLYAHVRRRGRGRNVRVGRLRGPCRSLNVRRRLFRRLRAGTYRVQFDVARRYRRARRQRRVFRVTLFRRPRASAASAGSAASVGERWERVD